MDMQTELSEVMDKLREIRRSLASKSGELAESSKLTLNIRKKEKEIRNLELAIGKLVYEAYKKGHAFNEEVAERCRRVDEAFSELRRLENEKEKLGLDDLDVEVVDAEIPADEDLEISEEENEILRDLGSGSETDF
jgi:SMC interacting uncharacterized protein involved in chromosome segregation